MSLDTDFIGPFQGRESCCITFRGLQPSANQIGSFQDQVDQARISRYYLPGSIVDFTSMVGNFRFMDSIAANTFSAMK